MAGSYEKINYSLRPAKSIERKMLCDAFRRLSAFGKVENYQYIGFGSTYFSDFILFHKALGITNMISIEKDEENKERFMFNRPFRCVKLEFGQSNEVLSKLNWDAKSILWLDYDGRLDSRVLADVRFFCLYAYPGSVIVVSVNAHPISRPDNVELSQLPAHRLQKLREDVGDEKVPPDIKGKDFAKWGTAKNFRRIINSEILQTLNERKVGHASGTNFFYQQLFNFHYADGAKMLTMGGLLYDKGQKDVLAQCDFKNLSFYQEDEEPYVIEVPNLTYREIRHLDTQLPIKEDELPTLSAVPKEDIEKYAKMYRYFPTFTEADI